MIKNGESDEDVINNILSNNDVESYNTLYRKYKKIIKSFILKKYSNYYEIDDDVSEILIKIFTNLQSYDSEKSKFLSWVYTVARNYLIDKWRCSKNNTLKNHSYNANHTIDNDSDLTTYFSSNGVTFTELPSIETSGTMTFENNDSISFMYSNMSMSDTTLLNMKYIDGYTYDEIGMEFNMSSTTVCNKVNYVKSKLKKKYSNML